MIIWKILAVIVVIFIILFVFALCKLGKVVEIDEERFSDDIINGGN